MNRSDRKDRGQDDVAHGTHLYCGNDVICNVPILSLLLNSPALSIDNKYLYCGSIVTCIGTTLNCYL